MASKLRTYKFAQTNQYIKMILKSGLLLEEDMDYVLMHYRDDDHYPDHKMSFFEKLIHGISFGTTLVLIYKKINYFIPLATSPIWILGIWRTRAFFQQKRQTRDILTLIESIYLTIRLNRLLLEYYKQRDDSGETSSVINPYSQIMKDLLSLVFKEELDMLAKYLNFIKDFECYVPFLYSNFEYLEYLDLADCNISNVANIKDSIQFLKKLSEIYLLVTSNALTCLCVAISPEVTSRLNLNVVEILDGLVPKMKTVSKSCYEIIDQKFNDVKYFYLHKTEEIKNSNVPVAKQSRLYLDTDAMLSKSSDILGKSQTILERLHENKLESDDEKQILCNCISNLRNEVHDFYESLDILHNLYEININRPKTIVTINEPILQPTKNSSSKVEFIDASLNSVEPADDEEYELYIGANDTFTEHSNFIDYEEEETFKYASAINRELKQKLKKHARFIAARQKLGLAGDFEEQQEQPPQVFRVEDDEPERVCIEPESSDDDRKSKSMPATPRTPSRVPRRSRIPRSLPLTPRRRGNARPVRGPGLPIAGQAGPSGAAAAAGGANADPEAGPSNENFDLYVPSFPLPIPIPDPLPLCVPFNAGQDGVPPPPPPPLRPIPLGPYGDVASSYYNVEDFLESIRNDENRPPEDVFEIDLTNDESD